MIKKLHMNFIPFFILISSLLFVNCSKIQETTLLEKSEKTINYDNNIRNVNLKSSAIVENLIQYGPFVGGVTETKAVFYVQPFKTSAVRFQISDDSSYSDPFYSEEVTTIADKFNSVNIEVNKLKPSTKYFYRAVIDGNLTERSHSFKTFSSNKDYDFSFGFGSCQQGRSASSPDLFPVMAKDSLRFFIHLGDWTYPDFNYPGRGFNQTMTGMNESYRDKYDYTYPFVNEILTIMAIAYVYDDHEYAGNDADGTDPYKSNSVRAYDDFFPHYKLENPDNGIWQSFKFGDVEFFLLDLRTQRSSKENVFDDSGNFVPPAGHSILSGFTIDGVDQKTWLKNSLTKSDAKWKVIVSSVIFNPRYYEALNDERIKKGFPNILKGIADKWAGFPEDMNFLTDLIKENNIKNVIMLSGDSHSSYIDDGSNSVIPEISSSNLDTKNSKLGLITSLAGYNIWNQGSYNDDGDAYGKVSFHFGDDEYALLEIIDQNGSSVISYKLNKQ